MFCSIKLIIKALKTKGFPGNTLVIAVVMALRKQTDIKIVIKVTVYVSTPFDDTLHLLKQQAD